MKNSFLFRARASAAVSHLRLFSAALLVSMGLVQPAWSDDLRVMVTGLGSGTVTSSPGGINCGATCDATFPDSAMVTLTASAANFIEWRGDCTGPGSCVVNMNAPRSVRTVYGITPAIPPLVRTPDSSPSGLQSFSPEQLATYLAANTQVNTPARFIAALPDDFRQNWILMTRSESLQTGTARYPRILLQSEDAKSVFTLGMSQHSSYPGAHPNAIEYMQWDAADKNFRFHEIVLDAIPAMDADGDGVGVIDARSRGVSIDDDKCHKCHSTRNVLNVDRTVTPAVPGTTAGTTGTADAVGIVKAKNKPNWDTYDSWAGLSPFNRDRIYQGSVEAAAFRNLMNPWSWRTDPGMRAVIEQLALQPPDVPAGHADYITRLEGGADDGHVVFAFDPPTPAPSGTPTINTAYSFDGVAGSGTGTTVPRGGPYVMLRHTKDGVPGGPQSVGDEGRGVQLFDTLGGLDGNLNPQRIADELIDHRFATGSIDIDVRPFVLAISKVPACIRRNETMNTVERTPGLGTTGTPALAALDFFERRNGMRINNLYADSRARSFSLPLRKVDLQKFNFDRTGDFYLDDTPAPGDNLNGLIQEYGGATSQGVDTGLPRLRQEVFRRPRDLGVSDRTVMDGIYVDREIEGNLEKVTLFRYLLEPLGVSVDKWSMSVRGRSRTYTFADVFGTYTSTLTTEMRNSLNDPMDAHPDVADPNDCDDLVTAINSEIASLPAPGSAKDMPTFTDIQRIFNKSCVECHGGLDYPPYQNYGTDLDISENETPPAGDDRLDRSHAKVTSFYVTSNPDTSLLYNRITEYRDLIDPADPARTVPYDPATLNENCPYGVMPCGGPPLSQADILTIRRWILGTHPNTRGDPHIKTVDGVNYDFQAAGEFVLLRGQGLEVQARQVAVSTNATLGPNAYTGLTSCVSLNSAVALRVGGQRITYLPDLSGQPNPDGLQLRINGELTPLPASSMTLPAGGRIVRTDVPGGIQVEAPGGSVVIITPGWWDHYQVWYLNISTRHIRTTQGIMGVIPPGSWLPNLPDGRRVGPRPKDLGERYSDLYKLFGTAWRVTNATTLFDYAPGISTADYTFADWPNGESPSSCVAPPQPGGIPLPPPQPVLTVAEAEQHCSAIVADDARDNCVQDVRVTGEPGFAQTYLAEQQVLLNAMPEPPELGFPENFALDLTLPVDFVWTPSGDEDDDDLTYHHCVWQVDAEFSLDDCTVIPGKTTSSTTCLLWVLIVGGVVYLLLTIVGLARPKALTGAIIAMIIAAVVLYQLGCWRQSEEPMNQQETTLDPGTAYYWKVVVEDGKGGTTESQTWRFETA